MSKTTSFLKASLGWGFLLWLIGYVLGMVLFFVVPADMIGWVIFPFGVAVMTWVLWKKVHLTTMNAFLLLGLIWAVMAVVLDYFLLVKVFNSSGYYKLDVYVYYAVTLVWPTVVGWWKLGQVRSLSN